MPAGRIRTRFLVLGAGSVIGLTPALGGCNTRDRITFAEPAGPDRGPVTSIQQPAGDTIVPDGPAVIVIGASRDTDGVEQIFVETIGGKETFPPLLGGRDTLSRFVLPISTDSLSGHTITLRIYATDAAGRFGDTAIRHITVQ